MIGIVEWAAKRARMVLAFIILTVVAGTAAYLGLPKEGEPDIDIPAVFVSVPFAGISAEDSESLLVRPMETHLAGLDGLKRMTGTAAEGYAGVALEFEFTWDKAATLADIRDAMNAAEAQFPTGADQFSINEINFSQFPIVIVNLTGQVPERTMNRVAKDLQRDLESLDSVLQAGIAGKRTEMIEVVIDPLRLESYNVTAGELVRVVRNNNQLIAAGSIESNQGSFGVTIPSSFENVEDIYRLPVKTNGDRVVTIGDLAEINFTFRDRIGTARFNGEDTIALQVVKRKGFNLIDTVDEVEAAVEEAKKAWPPELKAVLEMGTSNDQSRNVESMVNQLEGSVLTALSLVMIVVLAALGPRAALLVGFAIPTSFLLCFVLLGIMGVAISNIVMFGLILSVGMLVDGAIVVVEYADKRIQEGTGPMHAYIEAAQRMFWPIVSSTATTLCAFLPMLFWPGVPGQFMGMLPVTLIFVLTASLVVALIFLPVMGGVTGRLTRLLTRVAATVAKVTPWPLRVAAVPVCWAFMFIGAMQTINPKYLFGDVIAYAPPGAEFAPALLGAVILAYATIGAAIAMESARMRRDGTFPPSRRRESYGQAAFGWLIGLIARNPIMPIVSIAVILAGVVTTVVLYQSNNRGVEFFVESEPEQATAFVRARGNHSLAEIDLMVRQVEDIIRLHPAVRNVFSFAGVGGLNTDASGALSPGDTVGRVQFEMIPWDERPSVEEDLLGGLLSRIVSSPEFDGDLVMDQLQAELDELHGFQVELLSLVNGPAAAKPVHLRILSNDGDSLYAATKIARAKLDETPGLNRVEDTLPLPGIDWQISVDVEKAGRFGADVGTVGAMVQLVTRGILLDTMRVDSADEEVEIRVRLPEEYRLLSTLDSLKVRTNQGLVPLANFVTRKPVQRLAQINRADRVRFFDVKAGIETGLSAYSVIPESEDGDAGATGGIAAGATADDGIPVGVGRKLTDEEVLAGDEWNLRVAKGSAEDGDGSGGGGPDPERFDYHFVSAVEPGTSLSDISGMIERGEATLSQAAMTPTERVQAVTKWLEETNPFPPGVRWEWAGDQQDQAESGKFLIQAFGGALFLMFIILLTQFDSFYNSVLVLLAVVMSTTGVLVGMLILDQPFSIIMTGTGIVALAGIVVNNNIILIDTYKEYSAYMPRIEAIVRTAQSRIRPVLLTTITTMAGLTPMMLGVSLDFFGGGYSIDNPTSLWWKQLAAAVVFGLGIATILTLILTPSFLALRVWVTTYAEWFRRLASIVVEGRESQVARDTQLERSARKERAPEVIWDMDGQFYRPAPAVAASSPESVSGKSAPAAANVPGGADAKRDENPFGSTPGQVRPAE